MGRAATGPSHRQSECARGTACSQAALRSSAGSWGHGSPHLGICMLKADVGSCMFMHVHTHELWGQVYAQPNMFMWASHKRG